jgi:hypothetical protein
MDFVYAQMVNKVFTNVLDTLYNIVPKTPLTLNKKKPPIPTFL